MHECQRHIGLGSQARPAAGAVRGAAQDMCEHVRQLLQMAQASGQAGAFARDMTRGRTTCLNQPHGTPDTPAGNILAAVA